MVYQQLHSYRLQLMSQNYVTWMPMSVVVFQRLWLYSMTEVLNTRPSSPVLCFAVVQIEMWVVSHPTLLVAVVGDELWDGLSLCSV